MSRRDSSDEGHDRDLADYFSELETGGPTQHVPPQRYIRQDSTGVGDDESRRTSASSMALPQDHPAWRDGPYSGQVSPTSTRFSSNPPSPEVQRRRGSQYSMAGSGTLPPRDTSYTNLVTAARHTTGHAHASGSGSQHGATRRPSSSRASHPFGDWKFTEEPKEYQAQQREPETRGTGTEVFRPASHKSKKQPSSQHLGPMDEDSSSEGEDDTKPGAQRRR
ncbi:hypothetical protein BMF94_5030 [Rhodotorula taiwanensis]|uniref:Uncharacterized protein n=1 Tax=Rhodotorula taiwanensis TaxID=741276 RepID=A0A2S5B599_9BASI|nr:hypothetical protein BMF94_5030 [Rhodotorula taiwanensis]